jgi:putative tricarboxylic transport membrane protein
VNSARVSKRKAYLAVGACGIVFSIGYLVLSMQLPFGKMDQPGAAIFPVVAGVIALLASAVTMHEGWQMTAADTIEVPAGADAKRVLSLGAMLLLYFIAMPWLGHVLSSAFFFVAVMRLLSKYSWPRTLAYAAVMSVGLYVLFVHVLEVPMPAGVLDF